MARRAVTTTVDRRVRIRARQRCGYCLAPQHLVMARLEIEHVLPLAKGGSDDEQNLWLACPICNGHKADKTEAQDPESGISVVLFNPCRQRWSDHFRWSEDGIRIAGITAIGRATVLALHLGDDLDALAVRGYWVLAGWHPPSE
jgi:HNH endonuclease